MVRFIISLLSGQSRSVCNFLSYIIFSLAGFYLIVNMSGEHETSEVAVISTPMIIQSTDVCIGFWYYMLGASLGNLDLLVETVHSTLNVSMLSLLMNPKLVWMMDSFF